MQVAVHDALPAFRRGLAGALEDAGFDVVEPPDIVQWAATTLDVVALVSLVSDRDWTMLDQLARMRPAPVLVALLEDADARAYRDALRKGATAALPRSSPVDEVLRVLVAAADRHTLLPSDVAATLASGGPDEIVLLSPDESSWLSDLAMGRTVDDIALRAGYSTRTIYRRLALIYRRLGRRDRVGAILRASELGLLVDHSGEFVIRRGSVVRQPHSAAGAADGI
jgi:DNA-binding NarL/FixJ family response regulator